MKSWSVIWGGSQKDINDSEKATLNFFDLTALGVGSSLGVGISVLIGELIKDVEGPGVVVSIGLAGVAALFSGLCLAELGVRFLKARSLYEFCYSGSRENVAFVFGWTLILQYVAGAASVARGIIAFVNALADNQVSNFLEGIVRMSDGDVFPYFDFFSLIIVVVTVAIVLLMGRKDFKTLRNTFALVNVIIVIAVITAGSFKADKKNWEAGSPTDENLKPDVGSSDVLQVVKGAAIAFYGYIGFEAIGASGNEVKKRKRNVPLGVLATVLVTLSAFAGTAAVLTLMCSSQAHNASAAIPFAFERVGWAAVKWIAAVVAFFGFLTSLFGAAFPLHRIIYAMANDGLLFHCLGNQDEKLKAPVKAIVVGGVFTSLAAALFAFQKLVSLTVIGTFFAYTIVAVNIILLRYAPESEKDEQLTENWSNLFTRNTGSSLRTMAKACFNPDEKIPTNLTEKVVWGNLILFCLSSIGFGLIFTLFSESLFGCAVEAVVPASLLLGVMFLNLISITRQPKSKTSLLLQIPLVPLIPCLSIFLNVCLMLTLESKTWIIFSIWMAAGILPHLVWFCFKWSRKQVGENSLYEINKSNAVKLSDSIWKIKSEKKSFYEGAVNPVFAEDSFEEENGISREERKSQRAEKAAQQLKKAEIIHTADLAVEEKIEPWGEDAEVEYLRVNGGHVGEGRPSEDGIYWECVAEIHTEDEFPQESVVLQIVDNTYNFLSEVPEGSLKDDNSVEMEEADEVLTGEVATDVPEENEADSDKLVENSEDVPAAAKLEESAKRNQLLKEELLEKIEERMRNKNKNQDSYVEEMEEVASKRKKLSVSNNPDECPPSSDSGEKAQNEDVYINLIVESFYETSAKEILDASKKIPAHNSDENEDKPEEQNKIKVFKEKLNELLKNQINNSSTLTKNLLFSKPNSLLEGEIEPQREDQKNGNVLYKSIKTLNKSQIRNELEFLLAKGPPSRPSLSSSFNIQVKETSNESNVEKNENTVLKLQNDSVPISNGVEISPSEVMSTLQNNIIEKKLTLKNVNSELLNDSCS